MIAHSAETRGIRLALVRYSALVALRRSRAGDDLSNKTGLATFFEEFLSFYSLRFKEARNNCTDRVSYQR